LNQRINHASLWSVVWQETIIPSVVGTCHDIFFVYWYMQNFFSGI
jgi:hypothetical protein